VEKGFGVGGGQSICHAITHSRLAVDGLCGPPRKIFQGQRCRQISLERKHVALTSVTHRELSIRDPKSIRNVKIERASISLLFWPPDLLRVRQSLSIVAKLHPLAQRNLDPTIHVPRFKNANTVFGTACVRVAIPEVPLGVESAAS
jgi:hypothetical protein